MDKASMQDVPKNMRRTGMLFFSNGFMEALQGNIPMCVAHVAHAAEILLKARIAQEHPLLIFSKLPKSNDSSSLTLMNLLESGRTFSYEELPDRLWAVTGTKIEKADEYRKFGRLRNQVIHFSMANAARLDILTLQYSFDILDPLVENFWGKSVIDFIKNDPNYFHIFDIGMFEDFIINKGFTIDERLRRLLGEASRKAWEDMHKRNKEIDEWHESVTDEQWEIRAQEHSEQDEVFHDRGMCEYEKIHTNWKVFLDSF